MQQASADKILYLLKTRGPQTAQGLAEHLGMTSMGSRQHLLGLEEEGLVESFSEKRKVGRPSRVWRLSAAGHRRFPDRHEDLTLAMLDGIKAVFGDQGLDQLIGHREERMRADYGAALAACPDLRAKVEKLAQIRAGEGYMAEVQAHPDGGWLLVENHCPICAAASSCQDFCRSELALFAHCLGEDAEISRQEHLLSGARRCVYHIRPRRGA
ncbi:metalloregulator ArsR/SmtB family transcription factor [Gallaecimonas sp. GXIMD4217]|uniref:helix-turn-helix transcriptional regulator n=1 Tax=Gallaecimonas sp. GXIMD4217 TaxID=3131927 RepID=UPI00311AE3E4